MFHDGDNDSVTLFQIDTSPGGRDEVDALGSISRKDDLIAQGGVDEGGDEVAGALVGVGGAGSQSVCAAVDVGVEGVVVASEGVDD